MDPGGKGSPEVPITRCRPAVLGFLPRSLRVEHPSDAAQPLEQGGAGEVGAPPLNRVLGGPKHYRIFTARSGSPGPHVSHAGQGKQRREVSREDRLPTR